MVGVARGRRVPPHGPHAAASRRRRDRVAGGGVRCRGRGVVRRPQPDAPGGGRRRRHPRGAGAATSRGPSGARRRRGRDPRRDRGGAGRDGRRRRAGVGRPDQHEHGRSGPREIDRRRGGPRVGRGPDLVPPRLVGRDRRPRCVDPAALGAVGGVPLGRRPMRHEATARPSTCARRAPRAARHRGAGRGVDGVHGRQDASGPGGVRALRRRRDRTRPGGRPGVPRRRSAGRRRGGARRDRRGDDRGARRRPRRHPIGTARRGRRSRADDPRAPADARPGTAHRRRSGHDHRRPGGRRRARHGVERDAPRRSRGGRSGAARCRRGGGPPRRRDAHRGDPRPGVARPR